MFDVTSQKCPRKHIYHASCHWGSPYFTFDSLPGAELGPYWSLMVVNNITSISKFALKFNTYTLGISSSLSHLTLTAFFRWCIWNRSKYFHLTKVFTSPLPINSLSMTLPMFSTFRELLYLQWVVNKLLGQPAFGYSQSIFLSVDGTATQCFVSKECKVHPHNKQTSWNIKMCCGLEAEETFRH